MKPWKLIKTLIQLNFKKMANQKVVVVQSQETEEDGIRAEAIRRFKEHHKLKVQQERIRLLRISQNNIL